MPDIQNTSNVSTNQFTGGMKKDLDPSLLSPDNWLHARNAVNNSHDGKLGDIGSEPANYLCAKIPYTYIGAVYIIDEKWAIFSTNNIDSEIGLFNENDCTYSKIVNDRCLNFRTSSLITGSSKKNFDCTFSVYWDDGFNPSRQLNIDRPIYKIKTTKTVGKCVTPVYSTDLDCEALRLSRLVDTPIASLSKDVSGGSLPNGMYQVAIAYTINEIRVTDYFTPSNPQSLFSHQNLQGSLQVDIANLDKDYEEYELAIISFVGEKIDVRKFGVYGTSQNRISIGFISPQLPVIPLETIPLRTPAYEKSDAMYEVSNHLIRVGIYTKPDFNYQLLANNIVAKWIALELPANYYQKGGNLTSYMRDEVYPFFIRWIYNTGEKSASYVIPGRLPIGSDKSRVGGADVYEIAIDPSITLPEKWKVYNTATTTSTIPYTIDQGTVIAEGYMGYVESTELYPSDKPEIWGSNCGMPIRHHKLPDNSTIHHSGNNGNTINILGVKFENIQHPVDFNGNPIDSIIGYEILRGSREGNKSIIAKGMLNNVAEYDFANGISTTKKGLYPNYPLNDLRTDPFLSTQRVKGGCVGKDYQEMGTYHKDIFTFHSPETQFRNPFLSSSELKIESEEWGNATGSFEPVFNHPKHKMVRDFALFVSGIVGVGAGMIAIKGKKTTTIEGSRPMNIGFTEAGVTEGVSLGSSTVGPLADLGGAIPVNFSLETPGQGGIGVGKNTTQESGFFQGNSALAIAGGTFVFTYFLGKGADEAIKIIKAMLPYQQFAYQYNTHGFYSNYSKPKQGHIRRYITNSEYLDPALQEFGDSYRVNNLFRSRSMILQVNKDIEDPSTIDTSRTTIGELGKWDNPTTQVQTTTSAYYASIRENIDNQYGQVDSIIQVPINQSINFTQPELIKKYSSTPMFGGDIYINRYTEKNSMFFFNDWMFGQLDGYNFDYNLAYNIPYARYWINTQDYDISKLIQPFLKIATGGIVGAELGSLFDSAVGSNLGEIIGGILGTAAGTALSLSDFNNAVLPNDYAHLDRSPSSCGTKISFGMDQAYFYLFANGVRDFFVESEINIAQRDHDDTTASRFYDSNSYTDMSSLFKSDIIKAGNNFKYDYSLSVSKLYQNFISWGNVLPRDYDPTVSEKCYAYYPNRLIYSLPQEIEQKKDAWSAFLANNYKDFHCQVIAVKNVNKTGALIYFRNDSPLMFQGVDTLQTEGGIKITIGDGGLFNQAFQSTTNSDVEYEHGSCQSKWSIVGLPQGLFSISLNQGKIFAYSGGLNDISRDGNKWWFAQYLPSKLLQDFPDFQHYDNPVIGIGALTGYDSTNEVVYFTKKDYALKDQYRGKVSYLSNLDFKTNTGLTIKLGDPIYFEDSSFTISYDTKNRSFISFHDWIPQGMLPSKSHLITIKDGGIWRHNNRCDLFCNFYSIDYPFEIEIPVTTGQEVTTLRSIEYILECYRYTNNCRDQFHILDENFDRAIIYNSEQCSGLLRLVLRPKNDPWVTNSYPLVLPNGIDILYSKEENKYRFNMFKDVVRDRGEFTEKEYPIWNVKPNGYVKELNNLSLNYSKSPLQGKKFRHYTNRLLLRKNKVGSAKMLLKLTNVKQLKSFR